MYRILIEPKLLANIILENKEIYYSARYKVVDMSDLICEVLSGDKLLNAIEKLGIDEFPQVSRYKYIESYIILAESIGRDYYGSLNQKWGIQKFNYEQNIVSVINKRSDNYSFKLIVKKYNYELIFSLDKTGIIMNTNYILTWYNYRVYLPNVELKFIYLITPDIMKVVFIYNSYSEGFFYLCVYIDYRSGCILDIQVEVTNKDTSIENIIRNLHIKYNYNNPPTDMLNNYKFLRAKNLLLDQKELWG